MPNEPDPPLWRLVRIPAWLIWQPFRLLGNALLYVTRGLMWCFDRLPERGPLSWLGTALVIVSIFTCLVGAILSDSDIDDWNKD